MFSPGFAAFTSGGTAVAARGGRSGVENAGCATKSTGLAAERTGFGAERGSRVLAAVVSQQQVGFAGTKGGFSPRTAAYASGEAGLSPAVAVIASAGEPFSARHGEEAANQSLARKKGSSPKTTPSREECSEEGSLLVVLP